MKTAFLLCALLAVGVLSGQAQPPAPGEPDARWSPAQAQQWVAQHAWSAGCNYLPSTAVNQLEMWQQDTFDPATIDRELGWAHGLGFNSVRVFLHDLAWSQDPAGFLQRMDQFLGIAEQHQISVLFVFFDSCWNPYPKAGRQPAPTPGVHNSQWVQSPGKVILTDAAAHGGLEGYVKTVLQRFANDRRIIGWDLFNEPNNANGRSYSAIETPYKAEYALILLTEVFAWARQVHPSQPLTAGVWEGDWSVPGKWSPINRFMLTHSDIVSFHCYNPLPVMQQRVADLSKLGRPLFCTEYMARPQNSRFETILPFLKAQGVAAYNWGFIEGKSQTNFPWDSWAKPYAGQPPEWFHDVLHTDGTPYRQSEAAFLGQILAR